MTDTATTHHQALGRYGERSPPTTWSPRAWWCSTATGGATRASSTWSSGRADAGGVRGEDPHHLDHGTPHEAVTDAKLERLRRLARRWVEARGVQPAGDPGRPRRRAAPAPGQGPRGARAGDRLMSVATTPTIALDGAVGHLVDVQADVSPGQAGLTMVGRCDVSLNQAPSPLPDGGPQHQPPVAHQQAGHDPALAVRPAQARHPLRPRDRPGRAQGRPPAAHRRARGVGVHRRAHPRRQPPVGARRAADDAGRGRAGDPPGLRARAAGARGGPGPRHRGARRPVAGPGPRRAHAARRCPRRRPSPPCPAASCSRGGASSGSTRSTWSTCSAWPTPASPRRWRPPVATTCC